jgi:2-polyprenyl-3-methyl-5-hydroxy-6-metoxy-1,4-benzoquinol methylase
LDIKVNLMTTTNLVARRLGDMKYHSQRLLTSARRFITSRLGLANNGHPEITKYSGTSFFFGKQETIGFIEQYIPDKKCRILDVGPGRGIYSQLLRQRGYIHIDAVEIYRPYIEEFELGKLYERVFHRSIVGFEYKDYDIVVMGDVIEHLQVKDAQQVIKYAQHHSKFIVVAVPYLLRQIGSQVDGSGDHRQPDLTREIFLKRYPGSKLLIDNHQLGVFYFESQDQG